MDHNVGMGRKNFGRGQQRGHSSSDRRHPGERGGSSERRGNADQGGDRWGGGGGSGGGGRQWQDNRNKPRGRWEHDDRVGPDYKSQNTNSPGLGRRGRGRGRNVDASPQFPRKNASDNRRNSSDWSSGGQKSRMRQDSEGSNWGSGSHSGQVSPQVYRRSSDPWGGDGRRRGGQDGGRTGGHNRNMPEGAELDRGKSRRPDAQVYVPRARRQQLEETDDIDSPTNSDLPPQGTMGRPDSTQRGTTTNNVYVPRVRRAEQDVNRPSQPPNSGPSRSQGGPRYQNHHGQENWDNEMDNNSRKPQRRGKSRDGGSRNGSRSGSMDSRNRFNDDYDHDNRSHGHIAEQTFYNRGMRALTPDDFLDPPQRGGMLPSAGGYNQRQTNSLERSDRPPSRTRRRRRSHSNSSRRSQPSPNRGNMPIHNQRDQRRGSDAWSQDQYESRNRRLSDAWSQDEYHPSGSNYPGGSNYPSGSNSLPRRQRRRSGGGSGGGGGNSGNYPIQDDWSPGAYRTEPQWSPVHQMNEPWGQNDSRTLGRIRRSSGQRNYDDNFNPGSPGTDYGNYPQQPSNQRQQPQQQNEPWNRQKQGRGRGRIRRSSGGKTDEKFNSDQGQRVRKTSGNWEQEPQSTPQTGKRWLRSPAQTRRKNKPQARSLTPSEAWSSDAETWETESMPGGLASQAGNRFPPTGNIIIQVTAGGRNVSDSKGGAVPPLMDHQYLGSPQHSAFLEESVRAQANDLSSKVSSMCADLSELKQAKEISNTEIRSPKHDSSATPAWRKYETHKERLDPEFDNQPMIVESSTSSSTSPSHCSNVRALRSAPVHHHLIDVDDVSSDGQSSVQPESSTSAESPDTGDSRALSSGGEQDPTPESWSPGPVEYSSTERGKEVLLLVAEGVRQIAHEGAENEADKHTNTLPKEETETSALPTETDSKGSLDIGEINIELEKDTDPPKEVTSHDCAVPEWTAAEDTTTVTGETENHPQHSPDQIPTEPGTLHQDSENLPAEETNEQDGAVPAEPEKPSQKAENEPALDEQPEHQTEPELEVTPESEAQPELEASSELLPSAAAQSEPDVIAAPPSESEFPPKTKELSEPEDQPEVQMQVEPDGEAQPDSGAETMIEKQDEAEELEKEEVSSEKDTNSVEGMLGEEAGEDDPLAETPMNWADMVDDDEDGADSWDLLFDETGNALDPKLLDELTIAVGKEVKVQKPQADYYNYQPKDPDMGPEYSHLLEIYDFPKELQTRDLLMAFKDYHDRGFDIKWVDDTHAIAVFSGRIAAESALGMRHPLLKLRPMSHATRQTKTKAKRCQEFLEPYRPRPETTAAVARNLVTGALGLKSRVPREKRDAERNKLREARDKKRTAVKQKKDAWEGNFGRCAMDQ